MTANSRAEDLSSRARSIAARLATLGDRRITFRDSSGQRTESASVVHGWVLRGANLLEFASMDEKDDFSAVIQSIETAIESESFSPPKYQLLAAGLTGVAILAAAFFLS